MDVEDSVTRWIDALHHGSEQSAQQLWERYFSQLVRIAGKNSHAAFVEISTRKTWP
jgi:hypothetical protein